MHSAVGRMRDCHQLVLNPFCQFARSWRMIICFVTVNAAATRIVEMHADEDGVLLPVLDRHPFIERNENVGGTSHDRFELGFPQLLVQPFGHIECGYFFWRSVAPVSTAVFS